MPVKLRKLPKGCFRVTTPHGVKAKCTSKDKAKAIKRILESYENGLNKPIK